MLLVAVRLPNSAQNAYLLVAAIMISLSLVEYSLIFSVENYSFIYICFLCHHIIEFKTVCVFLVVLQVVRLLLFLNVFLLQGL